jgi:hypothetical protein
VLKKVSRAHGGMFSFENPKALLMTFLASESASDEENFLRDSGRSGFSHSFDFSMTIKLAGAFSRKDISESEIRIAGNDHKTRTLDESDEKRR